MSNDNQNENTSSENKVPEWSMPLPASEPQNDTAVTLRWYHKTWLICITVWFSVGSLIFGIAALALVWTHPKWVTKTKWIFTAVIAALLIFGPQIAKQDKIESERAQSSKETEAEVSAKEYSLQGQSDTKSNAHILMDNLWIVYYKDKNILWLYNPVNKEKYPLFGEEYDGIECNGKLLHTTHILTDSGYIYDLSTGKQLLKLEQHHFNLALPGIHPVPHSVDVSPEGRYLITKKTGIMGKKEDVKNCYLYDLTTGEEVQRFEGILAHFSPNGKFLAIAKLDNSSKYNKVLKMNLPTITHSVILYEVPTWKQLFELSGSDRGFISDSTGIIIYNLNDRKTYIYDVDSGKQIKEIIDTEQDKINKYTYSSKDFYSKVEIGDFSVHLPIGKEKNALSQQKSLQKIFIQQLAEIQKEEQE